MGIPVTRSATEAERQKVIELMTLAFVSDRLVAAYAGKCRGTSARCH